MPAISTKSPVVNVEDWKRGNRTWSDAFNAAINFLDTITGGKGGEIFVPAGPEINLTTTITLKSNITIRGNRKLKVSAWASGATAPLFAGTSVSNVTIDGLSLECTQLWTFLNYFAHFESCTNVRLLNLNMVGVRGFTAQGTAVFFNHCTNVLMDKCNFTTCRGPQVWYGNKHVTLRDLYLYDCYSVQIGYGGPSLDETETANEYVLLEGIRNVGCYQEGIELNNFWRHVTINNCWIIDCARQGGEQVDCGGFGCGDLIINGLYIMRGVFPNFSGSQHGIRIKRGGGGQADRTLVNNLHISGLDQAINESFGISLDNVVNCTLTNIYISGGHYGISAGGSTDLGDNNVSNVRCIGQRVGIAVRAGSRMNLSNAYCEPSVSVTTTRGVSLTGNAVGNSRVDVHVKGATYGVEIHNTAHANVTGTFVNCGIGVWARVSASAAYIHDITAVSCSVGVQLEGADQSFIGGNLLGNGSLYGVRVANTATKALVGAFRANSFGTVLSDVGTSTETFGIRT
jgi:hypothetical protein